MRFAEFVALVHFGRWSPQQLRGDVRMPEDLLELVDRVGMGRYERWLGRYENLKAADGRGTEKAL